MSEKNIEKTKNYYNGIARGYSNLYHDEQKQKISKIIKFLPKENNLKLLDLGSGDGVLNQFLDLEKINLISFDLSEELLKLNSNKHENKICGSILDMPFENEEFDYISSFTVFQDLPDVKLGLLESKRVLKTDGIFILSFLKLARDLDLILNTINLEFEIIEKFVEEKDYIFVLKKK